VIRVAGELILPAGLHAVASDKTIVGVGSVARIRGGGLRLEGVSNVIVRNLSFTGASEDAVEIRNGSHHVWVDHCDLSNAGDGLVDIKTGASEITVSWNRFSDHRKTSLVGHDDRQVSDVGRLRVTYHHNWFDGTFSRHPRVRFGEVHVFNNYYAGNVLGVASTCEAAVVVEANYFLRVPTPTSVGFDRSPPGDLVETANLFVASGHPQTRGRGFDPRTYYAYTPDAASRVAEIVRRGAGVGRVDETGEPLP
jgi:pectate lyase